MAYNSNFYMPGYQPVQQPIQQPAQQVYPVNYMQPYDAVVSVSGMEGANAFQMPPNSRIVVFDDKDDFMYRLTTDGAGVKTVKRFPYIDEEKNQAPEAVGMDELMKRLDSIESRISGLESKPARTRRAASDE